MDRRHPVTGPESVAYILKVAEYMSQARREGLSSGQFAVPATKAKKLGVEHEIQGEAKGKYPIPDPKHARNALARVSQHGTPGEREAVRSKVYAKYPELKEGFQESHGGESPTAKEHIKKVEQGGIGKESCGFKMAAIEHLAAYLGQIAQRLATTTGPTQAAKVLGQVPLPAVGRAATPAARAAVAPHVGARPTSIDIAPGITVQGSVHRVTALFDELMKMGMSLPRLSGTVGTGGRSLLESGAKKGWGGVVGVRPNMPAGQVRPRGEVIQSLEQNVAQRGIDL